LIRLTKSGPAGPRSCAFAHCRFGPAGYDDGVAPPEIYRVRLQTLDALITPSRIRNYSAMLAGAFVIGMVGWWATMHTDTDPNGKPFGYDFITFYAQSLMVLAGQAAQAYVPAEILHVEQSIVPAAEALYLWHYPPPFALLTMPLALLPYKLAYLVFVGLT